MADKSLESFKIADKHKPRVKSSTARSDKPAEAAYTLGFARIESLLENEQPGAVGEKLARMLDNLESLEKQAKTPKEKNACKKARGAVERTIDLLDYLFRTKDALEKSTTSGEK